MPSTKPFAIVGSRNFTDYELFKQVVDWFRPQIGLIVSGGARGADTLAERYAKENGINVIVHKANWKKWGKSAGYRRNKLIVQDVEHMIAFPSVKRSKGTQHSIDLAEKKGIPVEIIYVP